MMNGLRDWSNVRYFLAVCRAGSTLAAARVLGGTQPTVARRIDALEHELGLVLFERGPRGFRLTEAGRGLIPAAEAVEAAALDFAGKATDLTTSRPIRITAPTGNFSPSLHRIIYDFLARHPGADLKFLPTNEIVDLMAGEADVALRLTYLPPDERLIRRKISDPRYALYGAKAYAARHGLPASEAEMRGHSYVVYRPQGEPRRSELWLLKHVPASRIVRTYAEYDLCRAAVVEGVGLGVLNVHYSDGKENLVRCFEPIPELNQEHLLLVAPDAYRRPEVRQFVKFFAPRYAATFR